MNRFEMQQKLGNTQSKQIFSKICVLTVQHHVCQLPIRRDASFDKKLDIQYFCHNTLTPHLTDGGDRGGIGAPRTAANNAYWRRVDGSRRLAVRTKNAKPRGSRPGTATPWARNRRKVVAPRIEVHGLRRTRCQQK
jgi:hypothetical protein